jgi:photosystem II stability/assembly factor-like uncharacterized protein
VYAATIGGGVLKTVNGGGSWTPANSGLSNYVQSLVLSPGAPDTLYAGTGGGVFKTVNGGSTWTSASTGYPSVQALVFDPADSDTLYAAFYGDGVFKTTNGGGSWSALNTGLASLDVLALAAAPDPGSLYAGTDGGGVFRTTDGGAHWTAVNAGLPDLNVPTLALDPTAPNTLYAGTRSSQLLANVANTSGVFKTTDAGAGWSDASAGLRAPDVRALAFDPIASGIVYAGGQRHIWKSADGGATWRAVHTGDFIAYDLLVHPTQPATVYAAMHPNGIFKSTDGGETWSSLNTGQTGGVAMHPANPDILYAATSFASNLLKTFDGGATWVLFNTSPGVDAFAFHPTNPDTVYGGAYGSGVFKTTNGGASWTPISGGLTNLNVTSLVLDPYMPDILYAGTWDGGVFKTINGGVSWTAVNAGLSDSTVYTLAIRSGIVYAATEAGGVFSGYSTYDTTMTWSPLGTGLAPQQVRALAFASANATVPYAGGGGGVSALLQPQTLPTLLEPAGTIIPAAPTYVWTAVPGTNAYKLRVEDGMGVKFESWLQPSDAACTAGEGLCRYTPRVALEAGPARWWVKTNDYEGEGPWGDGLAFRVAAATLSAPAGPLTDTTPTYTWAALPGAAYYYLAVTDRGGVERIGGWHSAAQAGCGSGTGTCRLTPTTALAPGDASWAIQAWNSGGYGAWSATTAFRVLSPPTVPTALGQFQTTGTVIPAGGTTTQPAVVFKGTGTDLDGDKVRLIVEVKPVGTPFNTAQSCYSVWVNSGTPAQCSVTLAPGSYHWRARMLDVRTQTSAWASYGGTDEAAVDVQIVTVPTAPTGLGQFQTTGTVIPAGGTTTQTAVVFKGTGTDLDGDKVRLIVEVKPVGTPFTGGLSCYSVWVNSGTPAQCSVTLAPGSYHWRARVLDARTYTSAWVSYGGTDEGVADFLVGP